MNKPSVCIGVEEDSDSEKANQNVIHLYESHRQRSLPMLSYKVRVVFTLDPKLITNKNK